MKGKKEPLTLCQRVKKRKYKCFLFYFLINIVLFGVSFIIVLGVTGIPPAVLYRSFMRDIKDEETMRIFLGIMVFQTIYIWMGIYCWYREKIFLKQYAGMSKQEQNELENLLRNYKYNMPRSMFGSTKDYKYDASRSMFIGTKDHIFSKYLFEEIIPIKSVVWIYMVDSPVQINMEDKGIISPVTHFYSCILMTEDGKSHKIHSQDWKNIVSYFPSAIKGYGKEQKQKAKEELRHREFLYSGLEDAQRKNRFISVAKKVLFIGIVIAAFAIYGYFQP